MEMIVGLVGILIAGAVLDLIRKSINEDIASRERNFFKKGEKK